MPERGGDEHDHQQRLDRLMQHLARVGVVGVRQPDHEPHEPDHQRNQRDRGNALHDEMMRAALRRTPAADALERRLQIGMFRNAAAGAHAAPPFSASIQTSDGQHEAGDDDRPAGRVRARDFESPAGVPEQMADAVAQVEEQRPRPAGQQDKPDRRNAEIMDRLVAVGARGERDEQPRQQDRADRQRDTRCAMDDRQRHRQLPFVYTQMRRHRPLGLLHDRRCCVVHGWPWMNSGSEVDAAAVLFPVAVAGRIESAAAAGFRNGGRRGGAEGLASGLDASSAGRSASVLIGATKILLSFNRRQ